MDSIETETYDKWRKEEDTRQNKIMSERLNRIAQLINPKLFVEIDNVSSFIYFQDDTERVVQFRGEPEQIEYFLKGYLFAKSSLPF